MPSGAEPSGVEPSGAELFARYAYPPNALGYCGPDDASVLLRRGADGGAAADAAIADHARRFEGAWVYLEVLAAAAGIADPLDARVVEAYWIGSHLLDTIPVDAVPDLVRARLPEQPGASWMPGAAHHGYHVFGVYPWLGLLARTGRTDPAVGILDNCRIRWAEVVAVDGADARICAQPLEFRDGRLALGDPTEQPVAVPGDVRIAPGDVVAVHWNWVCGVLRADQHQQLRARTLDQLQRANAQLGSQPVG